MASTSFVQRMRDALGGKKDRNEKSVCALENDGDAPSAQAQGLSEASGIPVEVAVVITELINAHVRENRCDKALELVSGYQYLDRQLTDQPVPVAAAAELIAEAKKSLSAGKMKATDKHLSAALHAFDAEQPDGAERLAIAAIHSMRGDLARFQIDLRRATECYRLALEATPMDHPSLQVRYLNLQGISAFEAGDEVTAEKALTAACKILQRTPGATQDAVAETILNLGEFFMRIGRQNAAEPRFHKCLEMLEAYLGENDRALVRPLTLLAELYAERGQLYRAEPVFHRIITLVTRTDGGESRDLVEPMSQLATLYQNNDRAEEAVNLRQRVVAVMNHRHPQGHCRTADAQIDLGLLLQKLKRYEEAELAFTQAQAIRDQVLPPGEAGRAEPLLRLASLYLDMDQTQQALPMLERCLELLDSGLAADTEDKGEALALMAGLRQAAGRNVDAVPLYTRALKVQQAVLGERHLTVADTMERYANMLMVMDRTNEAEKMLEEVQSIREARGVVAA